MANEKDVIETARSMFISRRRVTDIAKTLNITRNTIYRWADQYGWNNLKTEGSPLEVGKQRLAALLAMESKTESHHGEIELLTGVIERLEKLEQRTEKTKPEGKREKGKPKKKASNDFTGINKEDLLKRFRESQFNISLTSISTSTTVSVIC